jgi:hypothetical protein
MLEFLRKIVSHEKIDTNSQNQLPNHWEKSMFGLGAAR